MRVGEHVQLEGLDIEVLAVTRDGRPERAQFRFDAPLEAPSFRFYTWRDNGYVAFAPPRIGGRVQLPTAQLHLALPL
jgi:hypothetical protein